MGLSYEIRSGARLVLVRGADVVQVRDGLGLAAALEALADDGVLARGTRMLVDLRRAVPLYTYRGLVELCACFRAHHARWLERTAVLADAERSWEFARQYAGLAQRLGMLVAAFRTLEEARGWLELTRPDVTPGVHT